tara:strand:- start:1026 stop:1259 length:234 start_codon:yes stop_codon:yes gene_type:complete
MKKSNHIIWEVYSGTPETGDLVARLDSKPLHVGLDFTLARFEYSHYDWSLMCDECPECNKALDEGACHDCCFVEPLI